jgi:hypothetical protein
MRKFGMRGSAALLLVGLIGTIATAQSPGAGGKYNPTPTAGTSSLWSDWFGNNNKPKLEPSKDNKGAAPKVTPVLTPADKARELTRYQKASERRMEVCLKLQEIAAQLNDPALYEEAQRLNELAAQVYKEQAEHLLLGRPLSASAASATNALSGEGRGAGGAPARTASLREGKQ